MEKYFSFDRLSVGYKGKPLIHDICLDIKKGEIVTLIGPNGAGKSTILKSITRQLERIGGSVILDGTDIQAMSYKSLASRMAVVLTDRIKAEMMTCHDIVASGRYPYTGRLGILTAADEQKVEEALKMVHAKDLGMRDFANISDGQRQRVLLARAICQEPDVMILDEPTSSLTAAEVEALFTIVDELRAKGVSIVYISHKMDEILRISDEVTIMRDGQYIGTWEAKELTTDMIITKMVGRELSNLYPPRSNTPGEVVFEVKDFTSINPKSFRHVNFNVRKGEILGVAGLVGAQRTELMEGLFGLRCHTSGTITYKGKELTINQPQDAIKNGIAMLTEDRRATGILGVLSIADNVSIASLNKYLIGGIMLDDNKIEKLVQDNVAKLSIKTPSSKTQIQSLSGGNQQKVLIARWLANDPDVFIMDEPTRGIDVGAKYEIYCIIAEMAKQGKSIIMISSEMSELIGMSDRIMVMCDGRCTGFIDGDKANQENIMTLATQFE